MRKEGISLSEKGKTDIISETQTRKRPLHEIKTLLNSFVPQNAFQKLLNSTFPVLCLKYDPL